MKLKRVRINRERERERERERGIDRQIEKKKIIVHDFENRIS